MYKFILILLAAALTSCYSPPAKLSPGSTVTFVNRVEPTFLLLNPGGLFRVPSKIPLANGSAMMRSIVMEEAAKAGVRCNYQEKSFEPKIVFGQHQELREAKELAEASRTPTTLVMTPSSLQNNYDALAQGGFVMNHASSIWGRTLSLGFTSYDIRVDTVAGKHKPTYIMHFGLGTTYKGFAGGRLWEGAAPASKAHAIRIMGLLFRSKVAQMFGNPAPEIPEEILDTGLH
jgi:hypothetical protein